MKHVAEASVKLKCSNCNHHFEALRREGVKDMEAVPQPWAIKSL